MNSFGQIFTLTTFGESHGVAIGGVVDGMPAGVEIDFDEIQHELDRRRPGQSVLSTQRRESDKVEILSGIFRGRTMGTPIGFMVRNSDARSGDYDAMENLYRPSHADYTYQCKYGVRDHRGGGRASARETISRVVGGAFAKQVLKHIGVDIVAYCSQVGDIKLPADVLYHDKEVIEGNDVRCPDAEVAERMRELILKVKADGDSIGGTVTCVISGCPIGIGEPVFDKLQSRLAAAMMSINAAKGFDYGMGFDGVGRRGSEMIDEFVNCGNGIAVASNHSGGIQGGISNGQEIYFRVAFKPVATLFRDVRTVNKAGEEGVLHARGRHDPCVLPRAVPIVEAMAAMTVLDMWLLAQAGNAYHNL